MVATPITYYGGKQRMAADIVRLMESSSANTYVEPFVGGGAVLFAMPPRSNEIINDLDDFVANFWIQMRERPTALVELALKRGIYCERWFQRCRDMSAGSILPADDLEKAWAFFYMMASSFGATLRGGFQWSQKDNQARGFQNMLSKLEAVGDRLKGVVVHCRPALEILEMYSSPDTLFYLDPPYVGAEQRYAHKYDREDLLELMAALRRCRGHWVLSGYPNSPMAEFAQEFRSVEIVQKCVVNRLAPNIEERTELLITNIEEGANLFSCDKIGSATNTTPPGA